jgi:large conductance mechanosensitive channel
VAGVQGLRGQRFGAGPGAGFLIGAAFAKLVESLADNVLTQLIAAVAGRPDFATLAIGPVKYGRFLTDLLSFVILAAVMFAVVKLIMRLGIARSRSFGDDQCPYCQETIPINALICRACGQQLVDDLPSPAEARRLLAEQRARRGLSLPSLHMPGRRRSPADTQDRTPAPPG